MDASLSISKPVGNYESSMRSDLKENEALLKPLLAAPDKAGFATISGDKSSDEFRKRFAENIAANQEGMGEGVGTLVAKNTMALGNELAKERSNCRTLRQ
ncbi:MAG: hypothetical protein LBP65_01210 [Puniceicoccales bacterium]|nr:hypothetical protein [Puniceicoccales bacterium]